MSTSLLLVAIALAALSGVPALLAPRRVQANRWWTAALLLPGAFAGALAAALVLAGHPAPAVHLPLSPLLPELTFALDALAALFVLPVCLMCACACVFDFGYWQGTQHVASGRQVRVFLGLLLAALLAVLAAQDGIAFLMAWEVMALAAFFLVATEHGRPEVRGASWIYLAATHAGTLALVAFFCCWQRATGSLLLVPAVPPPALRDLLFLLALFGFGLKAGIVPLHFWLPPAHAAAPSHVSAVMSGVLIKTGVYGLARTIWLMPDPPVAWGQVVIAIGVVSALGGVAFAIAQHDIKRLLAWHSVENIGIIFLGLGTALLGRATGRVELLALGLGGALLHVWNHALFKGLLFFAAGATVQTTGTRELDRMGGLAGRMPFTAAAFLCGAVAISGLPPLNGFVSELLTYLGLFATLRGPNAVVAAGAVAIPALALTGAMALLCFVKVFGTVYLGTARSDAAKAAREAGPSLRLPMAVLAVCCALIGLLPFLIAPLLQRAIGDWLPAGAPAPDLAALAPLGWITGLAVALSLLCACAWLWLRRLVRPAARVPTWDCGYVAATPRVQYTAGSFAQLFVAFARTVLRPRTHQLAGEPLFPQTAWFRSHVPDLVLDRLLLPLLRLLATVCDWLRALQRGRVQLYLLYVFMTLLLLLLCK